MIKTFSIILLSCLFLVSSADEIPERIKISKYQQRTGNALKGYKYLTEGAYITSGLPLSVYKTLKKGKSLNILNRKGINALVPYWLTSIKSIHGTDIVVPNCFTCHASHVNGKFILGLGKFDIDFTVDRSEQTKLAQKLISGLYGHESPEYKSFFPLAQVYSSIGSSLTTQTIGMNPATRLAYLLFSHRDTKTLMWQGKSWLNHKDITCIPGSDVPPLWNVKKKNALYYTASGEGDFAKLIMSASLLTVDDNAEMRSIETQFVDVLEFLKTIEAPKYPEKINEQLAQKGKAIFKANCKECHGTYGLQDTFPNLLISLDKIGTDPLLANSLKSVNSKIRLNQVEQIDKVKITTAFSSNLGYIAPPLDGIWATAPYFHNGSVPDLMSLLKSSERPKKWYRDGVYDIKNRVGLSFKNQTGYSLYDTSLSGNSNQGHTYGDELTDSDRVSLIEYLKTL